MGGIFIGHTKRAKVTRPLMSNIAPPFLNHWPALQDRLILIGDFFVNTLQHVSSLLMRTGEARSVSGKGRINSLFKMY